MKTKWLWAARILVGVVFVFSGLIKVNDPIGFGYKLQEYFEVFHLGFLDTWATSIAIFLGTWEVLLGCLLLIGIQAKAVVWSLLALILFFTFLTFYSAYFEVVQSCGCFGDVIALSPWQSFVKDLVLLGLIVVLVIHKAHIRSLVMHKEMQLGLFIMLSLFFLGMGVYTYKFLPLIDFLPYKIGVNIRQGIIDPEGTPTDNRTPEFHDLYITDIRGNSYTKELLSNPYYNFMIVAHDLKQTDVKAIKELHILMSALSERYNIRSVLLTASFGNIITDFNKDLGFEVFYTDEVPLKSMVRANPGLLLLKDGVLVNKWSACTVPTYQELVNSYIIEQD